MYVIAENGLEKLKYIAHLNILHRNSDRVMRVLKVMSMEKGLRRGKLDHPQGFIKTVNRRLGGCNPDIAEVHSLRPDLTLLKVNKRRNQLLESI